LGQHHSLAGQISRQQMLTPGFPRPDAAAQGFSVNRQLHRRSRLPALGEECSHHGLEILNRQR